MNENVKCLECGASMESTIGPHRYSRGIDVVLQGIETRRCPECGEDEVVIPKIEELHRVISQTIARRSGQLKPREIRFLRTYLGYSSVDFANLLGVTPETVSRWERLRNPQKMARPSERLLRMLAQFGEPSRIYDLEAILLSDSKESEQESFRFTHEGGDWEFSKAC
jgi:putative zinc finger/helix-turn-helix YgiT family protein